MGKVKTITGKDGKPYISLEGMINEVKEVRENTFDDVERPTYIDAILQALTKMEEEYYITQVFKKPE